MDYIIINETVDLVLPIPGSQSGDTVTHEIIKSDGTVLQSGSMTFIRDEMWKVAYKPVAIGVIILKGYDITIDSKRENVYKVVSGTTVTQPIAGDDSTPTPAELIVLVDKAIKQRLSGGAVQSYSIAGRNIQYMTLKELRDMRSELQQQIASVTGGGRNYAKYMGAD